MKHLLTAGLVVIAGQAQAVSCAPASVLSSLNWAVQSEHEFIVVYGQITLLPASVPEQPIDAPTTQQAEFGGIMITPHGQAQLPLTYLTVAVNCLAIWCGVLPPENEPVLAFINPTDDGLVLAMGPCNDTVFTDLSMDDIEGFQSNWRAIDPQ